MRLVCNEAKQSILKAGDFGETTGIAEILRGLKRTHFLPIINDIFIRGFKCSVACGSVESWQSVVQCSGSN